MKMNSLKKFKIRSYDPVKDNEGNVIEHYKDDAINDYALIWPAQSKLQTEMYGLRINDILNMHYYGSNDINLHDMIIYDDAEYKVISKKNHRRFISMEIERK